MSTILVYVNENQSLFNVMKMISSIEIRLSPNMVKCSMPYNKGHEVIFPTFKYFILC